MSTQSNRQSQPGAGVGAWAPLFTLFGVVSVLGMVHVAVLVGANYEGVPVAHNPFASVIGLLFGATPWSWVSTATLILQLVVLGAAGVLFAWWRSSDRGKKQNGSSWVEHQAQYLGHGSQIARITEKDCRSKATRLGVPPWQPPGVFLGTTVIGDQPVYGDWEAMHIHIWGPRAGKTTSQVIPSILDAPGCVLATSNKRDVVDACRDPRAAHGTVWVFDPQSVANEPASWWWNPLSHVTTEVRAVELAQHFKTGSRDMNARGDSFFDNSGQDYLAGCLLAAAIDNRPITDAYTWMTNDTDRTPLRILRADGRYPLIADQLSGVIYAPDKQRAGVSATARQMAACLTNSQILEWITPGNHPERPEFDPVACIRSNDTLFSLSKEGLGNAGPLVTALTVAICDSAEVLATVSPGGRLPTPLLCVLDEAANVCRWADLPQKYSHYGSRGIIIITILQSWTQGVSAWGSEGMETLWTAANVRVYGGGVADNQLLGKLSALLGTYDKHQVSVTSSVGGRSTNASLTRERILEESDLAELPFGLAIIMASYSRSTVIRTHPWYTSKIHADAVNASLNAHDPGRKA